MRASKKYPKDYYSTTYLSMHEIIFFTAGMFRDNFFILRLHSVCSQEKNSKNILLVLLVSWVHFIYLTCHICWLTEVHKWTASQSKLWTIESIWLIDKSMLKKRQILDMFIVGIILWTKKSKKHVSWIWGKCFYHL